MAQEKLKNGQTKKRPHCSSTMVWVELLQRLARQEFFLLVLKQSNRMSKKVLQAMQQNWPQVSMTNDDRQGWIKGDWNDWTQ